MKHMISRKKWTLVTKINIDPKNLVSGLFLRIYPSACDYLWEATFEAEEAFSHLFATIPFEYHSMNVTFSFVVYTRTWTQNVHVIVFTYIKQIILIYNSYSFLIIF